MVYIYDIYDIYYIYYIYDIYDIYMIYMIYIWYIWYMNMIYIYIWFIWYIYICTYRIIDPFVHDLKLPFNLNIPPQTLFDHGDDQIGAAAALRHNPNKNKQKESFWAQSSRWNWNINHFAGRRDVDGLIFRIKDWQNLRWVFRFHHVSFLLGGMNINSRAHFFGCVRCVRDDPADPEVSTSLLCVLHPRQHCTLRLRWKGSEWCSVFGTQK